jgi:hypothetical protein
MDSSMKILYSFLVFDVPCISRPLWFYHSNRKLICWRVQWEDSALSRAITDVGIILSECDYRPTYMMRNFHQNLTMSKNISVERFFWALFCGVFAPFSNCSAISNFCRRLVNEQYWSRFDCVQLIPFQYVLNFIVSVWCIWRHAHEVLHMASRLLMRRSENCGKK